jgi:hypothetical protein
LFKGALVLTLDHPHDELLDRVSESLVSLQRLGKALVMVQLLTLPYDSNRGQRGNGNMLPEFKKRLIITQNTT